MDNDNPDAEPIRTLTKPQRRVLGVLAEKAFTTNNSYPLTLKALTTGCNQSSNRSPVTNYSEDAVLDTLEELRSLGLVGEVHTDGGRAPRYRHYMRKRFPFTEPQLAVVTELLLRGRQQMGELRARASRMVQIDGLPKLREELAGLVEQGFAQASGSLERRGIEADHGFYEEREGKTLGLASAESAAVVPAAPVERSAPTASSPAPAPAESGALESLREHFDDLQTQHEQLAERVAKMSEQLEEIARQAGVQL